MILYSMKEEIKPKVQVMEMSPDVIIEGGKKYIMLQVPVGHILFRITLDTAFLDSDNLQDSNLHMENHCHSVFEIHFVLKGSYDLEVDGIVTNIAAGHYFIIPPGVYHEQKLGNGSSAKKIAFRFEYELMAPGDIMFPESETKQLYKALKSLEFCYGEDKSGLSEILIDIRNELKKRYLGYYARAQALFSRIMIDLLRENSNVQDSIYNPPIKASAQERLLIIEDYFESYYNLNVECLADILHVSVRQLNRILKKTINMSYKQKALERRMEISKNLLKYTDMPINEIAGKVGYETMSTFSSVFRNKNGLSPSGYRDLKKSHK